MLWSVSDSRTFQRCQLQWFYQRAVGNHRAKDPLRFRAYRLGKLQSISMWRGSVVDSVLSETLIPALNSRTRVTKGQLRDRAFELFDRQLEFCKRHSVLDPRVSPSDPDFTALECLHYNGYLPDDEIATARCDVERAIENLFDLPQLPQMLKSATRLIAQRALVFGHSGVSVRAVPDVIAFYNDSPPMILDWKVHTFGIKEAWLQLGIYAIALTRCKAHVDFPDELARWTERDIKLVEIQLLTRTVREYSLSGQDGIQLENYISESVADMLYVTDGKRFKDLNAEDFLATRYPDNCGKCKFRSLCWEDEK